MRAFLFALGLVAVGVSGAASPAFAEGCYLCGAGSSSTCEQCKYGLKDTGDARKDCEKKGCKISGTGTCSTGANVKVCRLQASKPSAPVIAWCGPQP